MSKNREGTTLRSLEELKDIELDLKLDLPEIEPTAISKEELEAQAEPVKRKAQEIEAWIPSALTFLQVYQELSPEAQEAVEERVFKVQQTLRDILSHERRALRRHGWRFFLVFQFSRDLQSLAEVEKLIDELFKEGRLIEAETESAETLRVFDRCYTVSPEACFRSAEIVEVRKHLANLIWRAEEIETKEDLSWEDLLAGKPGLKTVGIPPEEVKDPEGSTLYWRPGGQLRIQSDGEKLFPVRIVTRNQKLKEAIEEAKELKVHLLLSTLGQDTPPFIRSLDRERGTKVQLLWHLLKRGERAEAEREERQDRKQKMAQLATVTQEQFFLEHQAGDCLVDLGEPWEAKNQAGDVENVYYDVFFLVTRTFKEVEGEPEPQPLIHLDLDNVPPHLQGYLAPCQGEHLEQDKFGGVPYPLNALLQASYGQTLKAVRINSGNH